MIMPNNIRVCSICGNKALVGRLDTLTGPVCMACSTMPVVQPHLAYDFPESETRLLSHAAPTNDPTQLLNQLYTPSTKDCIDAAVEHLHRGYGALQVTALCVNSSFNYAGMVGANIAGRIIWTAPKSSKIIIGVVQPYGNSGKIFMEAVLLYSYPSMGATQGQTRKVLLHLPSMKSQVATSKPSEADLDKVMPTWKAFTSWGYR